MPCRFSSLILAAVLAFAATLRHWPQEARCIAPLPARSAELACFASAPSVVVCWYSVQDKDGKVYTWYRPCGTLFVLRPQLFPDWEKRQFAYTTMETPEHLGYDPYPVFMGADFNALPLMLAPPGATKNQPNGAEAASEKQIRRPLAP